MILKQEKASEVFNRFNFIRLRELPTYGSITEVRLVAVFNFAEVTQ